MPNHRIDRKGIGQSETLYCGGGGGALQGNTLKHDFGASPSAANYGPLCHILSTALYIGG